MKTVDSLPSGFTMRRPTMDDAVAAYELVHVCDLFDDGMPDHTLEEMQLAWQEPGFDLATDAWAVFSPDGQMVGVADSGDKEHVLIFSFFRVHPDFRNLGIEEHLVAQLEARAREHIALAAPDARVVVGNWLSHNDRTSIQVLKEAGYSYRRSFWNMQIEMTSAPVVPQWPEGVTVRTLREGQDERAVFEMIETAFQDHFGHLADTYEEWEHWQFNETFDPSLWFLAFEGETLAGGIICRHLRDLEQGWVGQLGVLRPWRRKGLGMALLLQAFGEFYRRGIYKVGLGVDSQNLTGATRLYERAGMHVALQHDTYEKELRAGRELRTQSLSE